MNLKYDYSDEKVRFLRNNVKGISLQELTDRFNKEFNCNLTKEAINVMKHILKLKSGVDPKFKKNHIPHNKGKKMSAEQYGKCKATMFKKGNKPFKTKKIGEETTQVDGYTYIKVANPNKWELKHRLIWENVHGKIPKGYNLVFADKNKQNFDINNLILVSNSEMLILNQRGLIKEDADLTKTGLNIAKVLDKVNKRKK